MHVTESDLAPPELPIKLRGAEIPQLLCLSQNGFLCFMQQVPSFNSLECFSECAGLSCTDLEQLYSAGALTYSINSHGRTILQIWVNVSSHVRTRTNSLGNAGALKTPGTATRRGNGIARTVSLLPAPKSAYWTRSDNKNIMP